MNSINHSNSDDVTRLIDDARGGSHEATDRLFVLVMDELKRIASFQLQNENNGITIQATALVNEVWLKLVGARDGFDFNSRKHFFVSVAQAMRQILIDAARARNSKKRGGKVPPISIDALQLTNLPPDDLLLDLHEQLCRFEQKFPIKAKVVTLRYFGGMTIADAASTLSISTATAERYWAFARAWLKRELS